MRGSTTTTCCGSGSVLNYGSTPANYTGTQQRTICSFCHNSDPAGVGGSGHYMSGYTKSNAPADVGNMKYMWGAFDNDANDVYNAATYSGDTFTGGSTCGTVDCHYNVTTPAWYASATVNCSLCHSSTGTSGSGEPWASVGAHGAHDNGYGISAGANDVSKGSNCRGRPTCRL